MSVNVNGYYSEGDWNTKANGKYAFVEKNGQRFFLKEFDYIKWVDDEKVKKYPALKEMNKRADANMARMQKVNKKLRDVAGSDGDLVVALDCFRYNNTLYKVNRYIDNVSIPAEEIHNVLTVKEIDELFLSILQAISAMGKVGIIHADLKPENILLQKVNGKIRAYVTDFDDSFFQGEIPPYNELIASPEYYSPDLQYYIANAKMPDDEFAKVITPKSDQYSLGLVWHMYLTGELPSIPAACHYVSQAALECEPIKLSSTLDERHRNIITKMLQTNPNDRYNSCLEIISELKRTNVGSNASLVIEVKNEDGIPMRYTDIMLGNCATHECMTCTTDSNGTFTIKLKGGRYIIAAEKKGYPFHKEEFSVASGADKQVKFVMYRDAKPAETVFDPPLNGKFKSITKLMDGSYELKTVNNRLIPVAKELLKLYGITEEVLTKA